MAECSSNRRKTLWTSNFSFSHSVFKGLVLQTHKNEGLFGNDLSCVCMEDRFDLAQMTEFVLDGVKKNIVGKVENAAY